MNKLTTALLMAGLVAQAGAAAQPFTLAHEGKPVATIVVAKEATAAATFAAQELRDHVRKITGAELPVVTDDVAVKGPRILVGESAATRALDLRNDSFKPREYLIRFLPDTLVLMGKDRTCAESLKDPKPPAHAAGKFGGGLKFNGTNNFFAADTGFDDDAGTVDMWVWLPKKQGGQPRGHLLFRIEGHTPWVSLHTVERSAVDNRITYLVIVPSGPQSQWHTIKSGELSEGWHHIAATHSIADKRMELFIDGKSVGTAEYKLTNCKIAPFRIGGAPPNWPGDPVGAAFDGIIDEIRVSKTIRKPTPESIAAPCKPDADTTFLMHADETTGDFADANGKQVTCTLPARDGDRGTLIAAYDFLEKFCDVRWYAPGDIGVVCPKTSNLVVSGADVRRSPDMWTLRLCFHEVLAMPTSRDPVPPNDAEIWRLRMRLTDPHQPFTHAFDAAPARFLKDHPDWLAQGYDGNPEQPCFTNPEFIKQVVQDARNFFDGKGRGPGVKAVGDFFSLCPNDNASWCKCARCQAELNRPNDKDRQFSNENASDYIFGFSNKVIRELRKTHPDKWVAQFAYMDWAYPPKKVTLEPNIGVQMCLFPRLLWNIPTMENDRKIFESWTNRMADRPSLWVWLYYQFPAFTPGFADYKAFPGFFAHAIPDVMKRYHAAGVKGMYLEHSSIYPNGNYLMDQLEFYVTFKLADDRTLDGNKLIDEFFVRYYGTAAEPMKALYCGIEKVYCDPKSYPPEAQAKPTGQTEEIAWGVLGTAERMKEYGKLMDQATAAARTPEEIQRVALFRKGIWESMLAGCDAYIRKIGINSEMDEEISPANALRLPDSWKVAMDPSKQGTSNRWFEVKFDDSLWKQASISNCLEQQGYKDYLHAWYRTRAVVPKEWAGQKVFLYLGAVDETCWVWIDGSPVGKFQFDAFGDALSWQNPLRFDITKAVKMGATNQITVLVQNLTGAGGIWKPSYLIHRPADWQPPAWCKVIAQP